jgi:hypothetical protein
VAVSPFRHSSRSLPLNDSQYPFFQRLPGSMNSGRVPTVSSQFRTFCAVISAPLSDRTCSGVPCCGIHSPNCSTTWVLLRRRATRIARHSRVNSSIRVSSRRLRPLMRAGFDEIVATHVIPALRPQPDAGPVIRPKAPAWLLPGRNFQTFAFPDPLHTILPTG